MEKENWINEIIDSATQINKVQPEDTLFAKIQQKINSQKKISKEWIWLAAASILILLFINFRVLSSIKNTDESTKTLVSFVSSSNQLYTE